jgi:hypothetical protein
VPWCVLLCRVAPCCAVLRRVPASFCTMLCRTVLHGVQHSNDLGQCLWYALCICSCTLPAMPCCVVPHCAVQSPCCLLKAAAYRPGAVLSSALCACVLTHRMPLCAHPVLRRCAVLCCAVLCCAVLCCAVLCCAVLCCAVLCCAVLCCAVLCCAESLLSSEGRSIPAWGSAIFSPLCLCAPLSHASVCSPCAAALRCAVLCCAVQSRCCRLRVAAYRPGAAPSSAPCACASHPRHQRSWLGS